MIGGLVTWLQLTPESGDSQIGVGAPQSELTINLTPSAEQATDWPPMPRYHEAPRFVEISDHPPHGEMKPPAIFVPSAEQASEVATPSRPVRDQLLPEFVEMNN
jgi:hypothetical protein